LSNGRAQARPSGQRAAKQDVTSHVAWIVFQHEPGARLGGFELRRAQQQRFRLQLCVNEVWRLFPLVMVFARASRSSSRMRSSARRRVCSFSCLTVYASRTRRSYSIVRRLTRA